MRKDISDIKFAAYDLPNDPKYKNKKFIIARNGVEYGKFKITAIDDFLITFQNIENSGFVITFTPEALLSGEIEITLITKTIYNEKIDPEKWLDCYKYIFVVSKLKLFSDYIIYDQRLNGTSPMFPSPYLIGKLVYIHEDRLSFNILNAQYDVRIDSENIYLALFNEIRRNNIKPDEIYNIRYDWKFDDKGERVDFIDFTKIGRITFKDHAYQQPRNGDTNIYLECEWDSPNKDELIKSSLERIYDEDHPAIFRKDSIFIPIDTIKNGWILKQDQKKVDEVTTSTYKPNELKLY